MSVDRLYSDSGDESEFRRLLSPVEGSDECDQSTGTDCAAEDGTAAARHAHLFGTFLNPKAGMSSDTSRISEVVYEASKDSLFFQEAQRRDERTTATVEKIRARCSELSSTELDARAALAASWEREDSALVSGEGPSVVWLHIDMDAFYAACHERDDPSLVTRPMAVGSVRGVVSTANYVARKSGVRISTVVPGEAARMARITAEK